LIISPLLVIRWKPKRLSTRKHTLDGHDLEEDIESAFAGNVEITGGGSGSMGWNVDLLLHHEAALEPQIERLRAFLSNWGVPQDTSLSVITSAIENAERVMVYPK
jgi:hypothetical protein